MKSKIYAFLLFFFLGLNFTLAGGIEDETKNNDDVELTTREDISEFQELQEPLYEKLDEIVADGCTAGQRIVKYSKGCVTCLVAIFLRVKNQIILLDINFI